MALASGETMFCVTLFSNEVISLDSRKTTDNFATDKLSFITALVVESKEHGKHFCPLRVCCQVFSAGTCGRSCPLLLLKDSFVEVKFLFQSSV